ncbi:U6 snRNA-associated Sm-like protein [Fragilaria crotonensis]|nr:U6 snRNA-associated Sm-like protein [Fragilaria crotonensis]
MASTTEEPTPEAPPVEEPVSQAKSKRSPSDFLKSVLGRPVRVKLNSGIEYRGVLACLDGYMNIAMEQTEEFVEGQLKAKYGDCFIRGNNVLYISTPKKT